MSFPFLPKLRAAGCGDPGADIPYSLALTNGGYLSLAAPSVPTASRRLATFDFGVHLYAPGVYCLPFSTNHGSNANYFFFGFNATGTFSVNDSYSNTIGFQLTTTAAFRDPAAHYLIHIEIDTTQPVASDRVRVWINSVLQTLTGTFPPINYDMAFLGNAVTHYLSSWNGVPASIAGGPDIQISRFVYSPSIIPVDAFGYVNRFGVFVPRKFTGVAAGYILDFADPLNLGKDVSGNGRHFTPTGLTVANQVTDTPTHGYPTLNPLRPGSSAALSLGNLKETVSVNTGYPRQATRLMTSGRWFAEVECIGSGGGGAGNNQNVAMVGIQKSTATGVIYAQGVCYYSAPQKIIDGVPAAYGAPWGTPSVSYVIGILADIDAGTIEFFLDGVSQGVFAFNPAGAAWSFCGSWGSSTGGGTFAWNFGQRPFAHPENQGTAKAHSTPNLPCPAIKTPPKYVTTRLRSGGAGVADLPWSPLAIKTLVLARRYDAASPWRINASILPGQPLTTVGTAVPAAEDGLTFTSAGYAIGAAAAYQGSRVDTIWRASAAAGCDLLLVDHVAGVPTTVSHAVGGIVDFAMVFPLAGGNQRGYHRSLAAGQYIVLNTDTIATDAGWWASSAVDLTLGGALATGRYLVAAFRAVPGFSAFGSWVGNAAADGAFAPMDFVPALVLERSLSTSHGLWLFDTARSPANPVDNRLPLNATDIPATGHALDFVSNGIKARSASAYVNGSGAKHIFAAWAETPGKFARAR